MISTAAALLCAIASLDASSETKPESPSARFDAALNSVRDAKSTLREPAIAEIAHLGRAAVPLALDVLESRRLPPHGDLRERDTGKPNAINLMQLDVLYSALRELGARDVLTQIDARLSNSVQTDALAHALEAYGELGLADDVLRMFELASRDANSAEDTDGPLRRALARLLVRDPRAEPAIDARWSRCPKSLVPQALFALGDSHDGRALKILLDALQSDAELVTIVAGQIPRVGRSPHADVNFELCDRLRTEIGRREPQFDAVYLRALAALEDPRSLQVWIDALGSPDANLRSAALWSLGRVTRLDFGESVDAWLGWYKDESAWIERRHPALVEQLGAKDPSKVADAIRELVGHREIRHQIAPEIANVLDRKEPAMRAMAAHALAELGSVDALPRLVAALDDADAKAREAVKDALHEITGAPFDRDASSWQVLIEDRSR